MDKKFFSVSELNILIKEVLNMGFPQALWVCGEIQQFNRSKNKKHIFFQLVEKDKQTHDVKACIDLVIWETRKQYIESVLKKAENAFELKDDIEVKFACRVDFYPPHGKVRLIVEDIDPVYTLGKIAQEKQRLIALLKEKGILDKNKTCLLPLVPLSIGLITSDDSAAYNDFCSELRKSGFHFSVILRNTIMQGKNAENDVCRSLDILSQRKDIDVIIITRGGGSITDLSCFDSQKIAEKIASVSVPVLTGIGHEIDTTITDLAAHTFQKTPTAVAQFIVVQITEFLRQMDEHSQHIIDLSQEKIRQEKQLLKKIANDLESQTRGLLKQQHTKIIQFLEFMKHRPKVFLKNAQKELEEKKKIFKKAIVVGLQGYNKRLEHFEKLIKAFHPQNTLRRGFSITRGQDRKILKSVKNLKRDESLITEISDGFITSRISEIKKGRA
ncbi:MAG TPA: exodeoxyribonuclease VII large subunit [Candidatus Omnitrophota bacterium]|nr:exodeoxyribonuclease VII large subunit [Candidatus Omnitrophota bacterium]HPN87910.1 exodeoxyribonuclease VII large subunit [Candidatus Omnitrophota bacterium]